ncbi:hypothetical protein KR018_006726, partial [Drosophila ironensis]
FFVFSPQCKIPYPIGEKLSFYNPLKFEACSNEPTLIVVLYNATEKKYRLHIDFEVASKHFSNFSDYECNYKRIWRGENDSTYYLSSPVYFSQDYPVPQDVTGMIVECHEKLNKSRLLQSDAYSLVQPPMNSDATNDSRQTEKYPNVFIFGIDSISRMHFRRSMPRTWNFVRKEGWFEMEGYNKVADNTFPNLLALLTGKTPREWKLVNVRDAGRLDYIYFLWKSFKSSGYLTAYAEDTMKLSNFNYFMNGFTRQPVDYYLRPFMMAIEGAFRKIFHRDEVYCTGRRLSLSYVFDYAKQLIQRFVHEDPKPLFGLFWSSSYTHADYRGSYNLDPLLAQYLEEYAHYGLFENSVVILMSDHGYRNGPLAQLSSGFLEERLPMLHIYLPPSYRKKYPEVVEALKLNRNRLSTNYDLHQALMELLRKLRPGLILPRTSKTLTSILRILPANRNCREANIPVHWCTCEPFESLPITEFIRPMCQAVVSRMNRYLEKLNLDGYCHQLRLKEIVGAEMQKHFDQWGNDTSPHDQIGTYRLRFITIPNMGDFRITVRSDPNYAFFSTNIEMISRLNVYKNDSLCVQDVVAKKFCVCYKPEDIKRY